MRDPGFWWRGRSRAAELLSPFAYVYGLVATARLARPGASVGIKILCVGNLTVGGAGKTPLALALASWLREAGEAPFFLTRGYGGRLRGPIRVDPQRHTADEVGDEPLLLARVAPTIVARDRLAGARTAREGGASVVVMDDGFQNPSLHKDFSVLTIDATRGIGNGRVFPAGPLRAPVAPQLERADALVVIGTGTGAAAPAREAARRNVPLFTGSLEPDPERLAMLRGKPLLAFAGIGNPDKFFATLAGAGLDLRIRRAFDDHARYGTRAVRDLLAVAEAQRLVLVTTEKDMMRLAGEPASAALARQAQVLPVRLMLSETAEFRRLTFDRLGIARDAPDRNGPSSRGTPRATGPNA